MRFNQLSKWLSWQETLHPKSIDLNLERVRFVAERMGLTKHNAKIVTIAGTNGKGSCVAFISAILQAQGYRLGVYTSPHLLRYNERIQIHGQLVTDDQLCAAFASVDEARKDITLTYFEFGTLAAFYLFKQAKLDAWILEVGLGGRMDAVNILDADVAVISSIDLDHMQWLGNDREVIGYEKAGIMRPNKPIIYGDKEMPSSIVQAAISTHARLYALNQAYFYADNGETWAWWNQDQRFDHLPKTGLLLPNAAASLMAIQCLSSLPVTYDAITKGLRQANLLGRFQIVAKPILTVLDVAHNPAASIQLQTRLQQQPCLGKTYAVVGLLSDKDIDAILRPLLADITHWYLASLNMPRGADAQRLADSLKQQHIHTYDLFKDPKQAYLQAVSEASQHDRIIVFGSFHTVGAVLEELASHAYLA